MSGKAKLVLAIYVSIVGAVILVVGLVILIPETMSGVWAVVGYALLGFVIVFPVLALSWAEEAWRARRRRDLAKMQESQHGNDSDLDDDEECPPH